MHQVSPRRTRHHQHAQHRQLPLQLHSRHYPSDIAMRRPVNRCSICGSVDHKQQLHGDQLSRGEEAGRLVYDEGLSFAEAGRRIGVTRQTAYWGWRRYVRRREICKSL